MVQQVTCVLNRHLTIMETRDIPDESIELLLLSDVKSTSEFWGDRREYFECFGEDTRDVEKTVKFG